MSEVKVYTYESKYFCDLVFVDPDFGVIAIEEWDRKGETDTFDKNHWHTIDQYESTLKCKWQKTYVGEI